MSQEIKFTHGSIFLHIIVNSGFITPQGNATCSVDEISCTTFQQTLVCCFFFERFGFFEETLFHRRPLDYKQISAS
jgi:hypothetical protein